METDQPARLCAGTSGWQGQRSPVINNQTLITTPKGTGFAATDLPLTSAAAQCISPTLPLIGPSRARPCPDHHRQPTKEFPKSPAQALISETGFRHSDQRPAAGIRGWAGSSAPKFRSSGLRLGPPVTIRALWPETCFE
jgi:hypothetical protein